MDFTFSPEQDALRESVRAVLDDAAARGVVRAALDDPAAVAPVWAQMIELGWTGLSVPVEYGGLGLGLVDAVVVLEELGRRTFPGPFLSAAVIAARAAAHFGATELSALLAAGARGTVAIEEQGDGEVVDRVRTRAQRRGATWRLTGVYPFVLDAAEAEWLLVPALTQEGRGAFVVRRDDAVVEPAPLLDPTRAAARVVLDAAPGAPVGRDGDLTSTWRRIADDAAVALAAELVGVAEAAMEMATEYAKVRVQFDVPLASHQVIQHKIVDMLHALELGRVGVHYAAWASDTDDPSRAEAASVAKSAMGEAAVAITGQCIQVHGAVGFTWDSDAHLLYKRAKANDVMLGAASTHRARIARLVLDSA